VRFGSLISDRWTSRLPEIHALSADSRSIFHLGPRTGPTRLINRDEDAAAAPCEKYLAPPCSPPRITSGSGERMLGFIVQRARNFGSVSPRRYRRRECVFVRRPLCAKHPPRSILHVHVYIKCSNFNGCTQRVQRGRVCGRAGIRQIKRRAEILRQDAAREYRKRERKTTSVTRGRRGTPDGTPDISECQSAINPPPESRGSWRGAIIEGDTVSGLNAAEMPLTSKIAARKQRCIADDSLFSRN